MVIHYSIGQAYFTERNQINLKQLKAAFQGIKQYQMFFSPLQMNFQQIQRKQI